MEFINQIENEDIKRDKRIDAAFNKDEWKMQKQKEREDAFALIDSTAEAVVKHSENLKAYFDLISRLDRYSLGNTLLIFAKSPDATKLMDFNSWKDQGVRVRKGEAGITIIEPGEEYIKEDGNMGISYTTKKVFDISQTTAKEEVYEAEFSDYREKLHALIKDIPVVVNVTGDVPEGEISVFDKEKNEIRIRGGLDEDTIFKQMAKEVSLVFFNEKSKGVLTDETKAKVCSYILCKRYGINPGKVSFEDVSSGLKHLDANSIRAELSQIKLVTSQITVKMDMQLKKESYRTKVMNDSIR